jgi:hypothetical protein
LIVSDQDNTFQMTFDNIKISPVRFADKNSCVHGSMTPSCSLTGDHLSRKWPPTAKAVPFSQQETTIKPFPSFMTRERERKRERERGREREIDRKRERERERERERYIERAI